jgi:hypothetical protein
VHAKSIPPTEVTKCYLCSYFNSLYQIRQQSVSEVLKGKRPCVSAVGPKSVIPKTCSNPWLKPDNGWSALSVDGSFDDDGKAG